PADARTDVYDAKGLGEHVLDALGVGRLRPGGAGRLAGFEPDSHGTLATDGGAVAAEFGEVAARVREAFGIDAPVFAAAVSLDVAAAAPQPPLRYQALPRFPAVQRDLAFVLGADQPLTAAELEAKLVEAPGPLRDENLQLRREVRRLTDERKQVLTQVDSILKDIVKLDLDKPE